MTSIATMPAGPELDALVAKALDGHSPDWDIENASTYTPSAVFALEAWRERHPEWTAVIMLPAPDEPVYCVHLWPVSDANATEIAVASTLALAICRAIAMAGEVR